MKRFMTLAAATVLTAGTLAGCGAAGSGKDIGRDAALEEALSDAQTTEENVTRLKVSEDREDGQKVYEIRFDAGGMEYDYEVAASDGQILNAEREELIAGSTASVDDTAARCNCKFYKQHCQSKCEIDEGRGCEDCT